MELLDQIETMATEHTLTYKPANRSGFVTTRFGGEVQTSLAIERGREQEQRFGGQIAFPDLSKGGDQAYIVLLHRGLESQEGS